MAKKPRCLAGNHEARAAVYQLALDTATDGKCRLALRWDCWQHMIPGRSTVFRAEQLISHQGKVDDSLMGPC